MNGALLVNVGHLVLQICHGRVVAFRFSSVSRRQPAEHVSSANQTPRIFSWLNKTTSYCSSSNGFSKTNLGTDFGASTTRLVDMDWLHFEVEELELVSRAQLRTWNLFQEKRQAVQIESRHFSGVYVVHERVQSAT